MYINKYIYLHIFTSMVYENFKYIYPDKRYLGCLELWINAMSAKGGSRSIDLFINKQNDINLDKRHL